MTSVEIRPATGADAAELAAAMRPDDTREVEGLSGETPISAVERGMKESDWTLAMILDGQVAAIWGARAFDDSKAWAWLLTSTVVDKHPKAFWRASKEALRSMLESYDMLLNLIDARHAKAIRWARRLGFHLAPPVAFGSKGLPCHPFYVTKEIAHV